MTTVISTTTHQPTSTEVHAEIISARVAGTVAGPISDGAAVAIAAWWQGPVRGNGLNFAELASTGRTDLAGLLADIEQATATAQSDTPGAVRDESISELVALFAWVSTKL